VKGGKLVKRNSLMNEDILMIQKDPKSFYGEASVISK